MDVLTLLSSVQVNCMHGKQHLNARKYLLEVCEPSSGGKRKRRRRRRSRRSRIIFGRYWGFLRTIGQWLRMRTTKIHHQISKIHHSTLKIYQWISRRIQIHGFHFLATGQLLQPHNIHPSC